MAEACAPLLTGGYECEFVAAVPDSLSCPVCLLPLRDPQLLDCCGAKYCAVCIGRVKAAGQPCPLCNEQQFTTMLDKNDQRKVLSLMVCCSKKNDGCNWEGELRHLEHHQMEECGWALVKCRYECDVRVPRPQLVEHELHSCPKRPVDVSAMTKMKERHKKEMDTAQEKFRREMVAVKEEIERKNQEITAVKEEMESKEKSMNEEFKKKEQEIATMKEKFRKQIDRGEQVTEKLAEQRKEIKYTSRLKGVTTFVLYIIPFIVCYWWFCCSVHLSFPPCELVMTEYSQHKRDGDAWFSPPFYTGPEGYNMSLMVYANGHKDGAGTHVSVYVSLMRGEYDDILTWPFRGSITIQLVNQNRDQNHVVRYVDFTDEHGDDVSGRVTSGVRAEMAWGYSVFISHAELESTADTKQYLKYDCIKFRVTKIVVYSV